MSGRAKQEVNVHRKRVVAVISSYQPTQELVEHCAQLAPQVAEILVVDDGSDERGASVLDALSAARVIVIKLAGNSGIGAAINTGFEHARQLGLEFVVTFDQDSTAPAGFMDSLVDEYDRLASKGVRVGMVTPEYYSATPQSRPERVGDYIEAYAPIQSGMLMPLSVIDALGPQREDLFIDMIDTEYFLRAKRAGYIAVCAPHLTLDHGFGHRLYINVFGRRLKKPNGQPRMVKVSSPFRYYYRARNRVLVSREFAAEPAAKKVLVKQMLNDTLVDFNVALYSAKGRFTLLKLIVSGWVDGLRGRTGKIPSPLSRQAQRVQWRHPVVDEST